METFGRKLGQAMRLHGLRLEEVARETGLDVEEIEALERDELDTLPDDDRVQQGLRSFAWLVEVDPEQVLADFREERSRSAPRTLPPAEPERVSVPAGSGPRVRRLVGSALPMGIILASGVAVFLLWPRASGVSGSGAASAVAEGLAPAREAPLSVPAMDHPARSPRIETPVTPPEPPVSVPAIESTPGASTLSASRHGVGTGIAAHDLIGETTRFAEGERVFFWARIEGGEAGETIRHVWIHDGVEELQVTLRLGGAHWRTHSYKNLNAGSAGSWAVEARDGAGRVIARREFSCSPFR